VALSTINQTKLVSWYFDFYLFLENISCNFHRGRRGIDLCPFSSFENIIELIKTNYT
jgi:hypothetical protein